MKIRKILGPVVAMMLVVALVGCSSAKNVDKKADGSAAETVNKQDDTATEETKKSEEVKNDTKEADKKAEEPKKDDKADETAKTGTDDKQANKGALIVTTEVEDGYIVSGSTYSIMKGGVYTFSGEIENGQIYVDVIDEVEIELAGVTMSNNSDSCIYIENAEKATVSAKKGTVNTLRDTRGRKVSDDDVTGSGCIYSKDDLKISGKGELIIEASYNNGIACKNDIKIKNLTLKVSAPGNAIKGNDSITIESGTLTVVSSEGDGLKTKNTDISSKGKQRGWIKIEGGVVEIYAADDCIKAAYDFSIADEATVTEKRYK